MSAADHSPSQRRPWSLARLLLVLLALLPLLPLVWLLTLSRRGWLVVAAFAGGLLLGGVL